MDCCLRENDEVVAVFSAVLCGFGGWYRDWRSFAGRWCLDSRLRGNDERECGNDERECGNDEVGGGNDEGGAGIGVGASEVNKAGFGWGFAECRSFAGRWCLAPPRGAGMTKGSAGMTKGGAPTVELELVGGEQVAGSGCLGCRHYFAGPAGAGMTRWGRGNDEWGPGATKWGAGMTKCWWPAGGSLGGWRRCGGLFRRGVGLRRA